MKILFARSNLNRKPKYQLSTMIFEEGNTKIVRKLILSKKSLPHLKKMVSNYRILKKKSIFTPKILHIGDDSIDFEYLPYTPFESLIEKYIVEHKFNKTIDIVNQFIAFMNSLNTIKINPYKNIGFIKLLDPQRAYLQNKHELCIDFNIMDFNFDNLLLDEEAKGIYLIDWEWIFGFPVPKNYVLFRSLFFLSNKLQSLFVTNCSPLFPCYEVLSGFYIPKCWWDLFAFSQVDVEKFLYYENSFQNSVNIAQQVFNSKIVLTKLKLIDYVISRNLNEYLPTSSANSTPSLFGSEFEKKKLVISNQNLTNDNLSLKNRISFLQANIDKIMSSKFFRLWQRYCKIRDSILSRKGNNE